MRIMRARVNIFPSLSLSGNKLDKVIAVFIVKIHEEYAEYAIINKLIIVCSLTLISIHRAGKLN